MTNSRFTISRKQSRSLSGLKGLSVFKYLIFSVFMLAAFFANAQNPFNGHPTDEEGCSRGLWVADWIVTLDGSKIPSGCNPVFQWEADTGNGVWVSVPSGGTYGFGGVNGTNLTLASPDGCSPFQLDSTKFRCRVLFTPKPGQSCSGGTYVSNSALLVLYSPVDSSDFKTKYGTYASAPVANDTVCEGGDTWYEIVNLKSDDTCTGLKAGFINYQWQYKNFGGSWTNVPVTNPTSQLARLELTNIPLSKDVSQYRCLVQSATCSPVHISDVVTLMVDPKPFAEFDTTNIYVCEGDSFTINIDVLKSALSANRGSLPTDWELYFDTSMMGGYAGLFSNAPLDSLTGTGNGAPAITFGHSGISTVGIYTLKLDSIVNSSSSLRCPNPLSGLITINVYPRPNATLMSSSPQTVCEGDSVCFSVQVTNAVFNGAGMNWAMYVTDPSGTVAGVVNGIGNQTITYCTNIGLITDSIRITIDSIKLTGVAAQLIGDSCLGTVGPQDSIDILILPKPFAALGEYSGIFKATAVFPTDTSFGFTAPPYYTAPFTLWFWEGTSPTDSAGAHYFDFTPSHDMRLDSVAMQIEKFTAGAETFNVWYRGSSYVGFETTMAGWSLANSTVLSGIIPDATQTQLPVGVTLNGGTTYGFYVEASTDGPLYTRTIIHHMPGAFKTNWIAPNISVGSGTLGVRGFLPALPNPSFTSDQPVKGLCLTYRGGLVVSGDTVRVCEGDSIDFDFVVGNVTYEGIPLNWELTFTDPSGTMTYTSPITGTGDSAMFDRIYTAGLVPGTYTFALTSIKLLPTPGAPIPPNCLHVIDDEFFTFEVVPKILAEFNKDTFNMCKGSGDVFDIEITNALFDGQPVSWKLFYTDPSGILPAGADTGTGNMTPSYTVPTTLAVGTYYIYLDSIKTVGTDPICNGITGPMDTIVINVLPYPRAALQATWLNTGNVYTNDTMRICQYDSVELKITIDSATWKGIDLGWTLNMVDGTGTLASVQTGYGDSMIIDTTLSSLAPGRYVIDLVEIHLDTLGLTCQRNLDSQRIVLEIYSRPHVRFSTDTLNVCQDDTSNFDVLITSALFEGAPFAWTLHWTDTSGLIWSPSPMMGSGNLSPTFGISTTTPVGQYMIVLDSIVKDFDPHCMGIVDAPDTLIVNVYPKPMVTLTPSTDTVCEGITTSYTISVSNTFFHGSDSVNWSLNFLDGTGSTIGVSPLTGYGDTTVTYTTSPSLSVGNHTMVLTSIVNTDDTCTRFLNDTFKLKVNFLPQLTILDVIDPICSGDSLRVSFRIDSTNAGDSFSFSYTVIPESSAFIPATVSGVTGAGGSYVGMFTVPDTFGYGPISRLLDFGPVTNHTTGCVEIDSVPDSTFYVHPLPSVNITGNPVVCSGHFDPVTGTPTPGWAITANFGAIVSGTTIGSLNKSWTFYYHVEDTVSGYVSTTHSLSGVGNNGGSAYALNVPDSLFYYFNPTGDSRGFKLIVDSMRITAGLALCDQMNRIDSAIFTVNPNPYFTWDVPDSICLGTMLEWDITASGIKAGQNWRTTFAWDTTANDATPYFGPRNFDKTGSGTFNVTFPNTGYPIYAGYWYLWSDTLVNKTTGCFYKPEKLDSFRVDPPTVADSLFGNTTVCEDDNAGFLYLDGYVGNVLYWECSFDEGFTWDTVRTVGNFPEMMPVTFSSALDTLFYVDKTFKTRYRVWVKSGACGAVASNVAHVYVNPRPNAAILDMVDFICSGDSAKIRINVTAVPTSNAWTVFYTTTSPSGTGSFSGTGTGVFTRFIYGLNGTPSYVTLDSIYNNTTTCHNTVLTDNVDSVFVYPFTLAGTLAAADTVCRDINNGTLTLTGMTGAVVKWQYREMGGSWTDIGYLGTSYNYVNLDITTDYRVIVKNGTCDADTSNEVKITVMSLPHAFITGSDTICPGTTLDLTVTVDSTYGGAWAIEYLEGSVTDTLTGTGDGNHTLTTGNIFGTSDVTLKRIWVTAPVMNYSACSNSQIDNPGTATVTIIDQATASINSAPDSICNGSSATVNIVVSNVLTTDVVKIDWSINGVAQTAFTKTGPGNHSFTVPSSSLVATSAPSTNYTIALDTVTNLTSTTLCAGLVNTSHTIRVDTATVAGTTSGTALVCNGNNSGTITLDGNIGSVIRWEQSNDNSNWTLVNNETVTLTYNNIIDTTWYRAVVKNGACNIAYSTATVVNVKEKPLATIVGGDTICSGLTDDLTITIENAYGNTWWIALLEGTRMDTITGTGTTYTYTTGALKSTTDVVLQSIWTGSKSTPDCYNTLNNVATSTVTVLARPFATIASGPTRLCEGSSFTFTVAVSSVPTGDSWTLSYSQDGTAGTVSGNGSGVFTANSVKGVSPTSEMISLTSITATNGSVSCDSSLSSTWTFTVDSTTAAGTIGTNDTVCMGGSGAMAQIASGTGSIVKWQSKVRTTGTWVDINNTNNSNPFYNVLDTTYFRAVYQNGVCLMANSNMVNVVPKPIPSASIRTIASSDSICANGKAGFEIVVTNVAPGQTFSVTYLEGSTLKSTPTLTQNGSGVHTLVTSSLSTTTTIELRSITATLTAGGLMCGKNLSGAITIEVLPNPTATITATGGKYCHGDKLDLTFNVSNVPTGNTWSLDFQQDGNDSTITGIGSGSFTIKTKRPSTSTTEVIRLVKITNTTTSSMCYSELFISNTINIDPTTVAGTIGTNDTVCMGGNSSMKELTGGVGSIVKWQTKVRTTGTWVDVNNTSTTNPVYNVLDTTYVRAVYQSGVCATAPSNMVSVVPKPIPTAIVRTASPDDTVCAGKTAKFEIVVSNVMAGQTFSVSYLEGSTVKTTPTMTQNASGVHSLTTGTLSTTTTIELRSITATLTAGGLMCGKNLSGVITIEVLPNPTATITATGGPYCHGDVLDLTFNISNVPTGNSWSLVYSQDGNDSTITGSGSGSRIVKTLRASTSTTDVITLKSITNTTTSDMCMTSLSDTRTINIDRTTVAGTIGTNDTVCMGGNSSMKELATGVGSIIKWQTKVRTTGTWVDVNNTSTTNPVYNVLDTTYVRAVYQSGVCLQEPSNMVSVVPKPIPTAIVRTASPDDTVCAGKTAKFEIVVSNVMAGQTFSVSYLEGSTLKTTPTMTQNASGVHALTTGSLNTTTTIELRSITATLTAGGLMCGKNLSGVITIEVLPNPMATITSTGARYCEGERVDVTFNVSNVPTADSWSLVYSHDGNDSTITGMGSGSVTIKTLRTTTATSDIITLKSITNTATSDMCMTSLSDSRTIPVDAPTVAGTIGSDITVCYGGSGTISETAPGVGSIVSWQKRVKGQTVWTSIGNTTTSLFFASLTDTTEYRAVYKNGLCAVDESNIVTATPKALPYATIATQAATDTVCAGNTATLSVTISNVDAGDSAYITYVQGSVNKSIGYRLTSDPQTFDLTTTALTTTTDITLQTIKNVDPLAGQPMCSRDLSNVAKATVTVIDLPNASIVSGPDTLCQGNVITFTVNVTNVKVGDNWRLLYTLEGDIDTLTGVGPTTLTHTDRDPNTAQSAIISLTEILNTSNLGTCKSRDTDDWEIYIFKPTVAGMIEAPDTICKGGNTIVNEVMGTTKEGKIIEWEYRANSATAWTTIPNNNTTLDILNLQETTTYRAIYKNGVCDTMHSNNITIEVRELPLATLSGSATICAGDSTDLTVTVSNVGSNQVWEIDYLAGVTSHMMSDTGSGSFTLRVGGFINNSDVTLSEIRTVTGTPLCVNDKLTNNATVTVNVNQRPFASLNSVNSPICETSDVTFDVSVGNVRSHEAWTFTYSVPGKIASTTVSGKGPGTVTVNAGKIAAVNAIQDSYTVVLSKVVNTTTGCDSMLSSSMALLIDAKSAPGSVLNSATVCSGTNTGTMIYVGGNGDVVRWESSTNKGASWTAIVNADTFHTYNNLTDSTDFRVVMVNGQCATAGSAPLKINVNPLPNATISGSDTICAGNTANLTVQSSNTYGEDWSVSYLAGTVLDTLRVSGPLTSGVITTSTLVTNTDVTLKKIWMTSGSPQCSNNNLNNNATATVEVNQLPTASLISMTDTVCTGGTAVGNASINNVRSTESWRLYWSINGGLADSVSGKGAGSFNFTTTALTVNPSVVRLIDIRNLTTGCRYLPTDEDTVFVSPKTNGGTLTGVDTVCYNSNSGILTLGADAIGDIIRWESSTDGGSTWSEISNTAATYTYNNLSKTTRFRVLVQSGVCHEAYSSTVQVVVRPLPMATIDKVGMNSVCEGSSTWIIYSVSNVMASQSWTLKYLEGSTTKTVSGMGNTTDTIWTSALNATTDVTFQTIKVTTGDPLCENLNLSNNQTTTINVVPDADATIVAYDNPVCVGSNPEVTVLVSDVKSGQSWTLIYRVNNGGNKTTNGVGPGQFSFNIGSLNTVRANGVRLVSITNTSTTPVCTAALSDSVTITTDPLSVGGTISGPDTVCYNGGGTLSLSGQVGTIQKWQSSTDGVNFYDIANTSSSLTFNNLTKKTWYRVEVKSGSCNAVNSAMKVVDVQALPTVTIVNPTQNICSGSSTSITVNVGNVPANATWTLTYTENGSGMTFNGSGTSGVINLGPYTSTATIVVTGVDVTNGLMCSNTVSKTATITVTPNPTATIDSAPDSLCQGDIITFTIAVDDVATGAAWELDYDIDGTAGATVKGNGSGIFTVKTLRAAGIPTAVITLTSIELVSAPACVTTLTGTHTINVSPTTVGGTLASSSATVCYGGSATLTLSGETGSVKHWEYSTNGGATWTITSNTAKSITVTNLTMTTIYRVYVQSGPCSGKYSTTATVTVIPTPNATVSSNAKVCPGDAATFTLHVKDVAASDGWSVVYRRNGVAQTAITGTGSGDFNFTVAGAPYTGNPTLITVSLVSITNTTHGCTNSSLTSSASAKVTPNPVAAFTASNSCEDTTVSFVNNSSIPEGSITAYKWYFGDGDSSATPDPTHTYRTPGTYNVRLVAWSDNGCRGEITKAITIHPNPIASFTASNVCQNQVFSATDASTVSSGTITSWFWTFGDGTTSNAKNPTHSYSTSGNYDVTLTVTTNNGCTNTVSKEITIYILPEASFVAEPVCEDAAMKFINTSAIGYGTMSYGWDFDGQGTSIAKDPSFTFAGFGDFNVRLIATSNNGCRDTINRAVTVHPNPTAAFTVAPVCIGATSTFVNGSSVPTGAIVEYYWDFADASFSGLSNPTHTYATPGTFKANLRVKTDKGCVDNVTEDAIVIALPDVQLVPNDSQHIGGCDSIQLSARSDARTWDWLRNNDTIATGVDKVFASKTGMYKVTISVSTLGVVCYNSDSVYVKVEPIPTVTAWPADLVGQSSITISKGQSIDLNASATGYQLNESSFVWDPTGVNFLAGTNVGTTVTTSNLLEKDQVFTVTVTDGFGCTQTASVTVIVLDDFKLFPYNLITPNGDGMNDTWVVENIWAYPEAVVVIFNRYGMEVFNGTNYDLNRWDGSFNGKDLPDGAYYYVITHPDHPNTVYKGAINLIRNR